MGALNVIKTQHKVQNCPSRCVLVAQDSSDSVSWRGAVWVCRRPIEGRVVTALGKSYCVEHFVCAKCEKPFLGNRYYERQIYPAFSSVQS